MINKTIRFLFLCLSFSYCTLSNAQEADVIIMAGQSNMMGTANAESDLPTELQSEQSDLYISGLLLTNSDWELMDAPNTGVYGNNIEFEGFGPEITFARRVADTTGRPIFILKWALGGHDLDDGFLGQNGKGEDALYNYLVREKSKIENNLLSQYGLTANYKAFLWMQGESDANAELSVKYRDNLDILFNRVRQDFKADLPVIIGRISDFTTTDDWNRVRDAQVDWA